MSRPVDPAEKLHEVLRTMGDLVHAVDVENRELRREVNALAKVNGEQCDELWALQEELKKLRAEHEERGHELKALQDMYWRRVG